MGPLFNIPYDERASVLFMENRSFESTDNRAAYSLPVQTKWDKLYSAHIHYVVNKTFCNRSSRQGTPQNDQK